MAFDISSIKKGGSIKPPIVVIHGPPGIGKTTFSACAESPVFLMTEDGLGNLGPDHFPVITQWPEVMEAMTVLYSEDHPYKTVVIDSMSALEPMIWAQVAKDANKSSIEDLGYGKGYVLAMDYWGTLLQGVIALRDQRGILPILIAHSEVTRFDSPEVEPYDRYTIKLHKRAFHMLYERADVIGFSNWRTLVTRDKDPTAFQSKKASSPEKILNVRGVGTGERLLHLVERPAYVAKNRYGMPETIPLDWPSFIGAMSVAQSKP